MTNFLDTEDSEGTPIEIPPLAEEHLRGVTMAFLERLRDAQARAGCNDLFPDEFSKEICKQFKYDFILVEAWMNALLKMFREREI
jgi:hypothetical protein